MVTPRVGPYEPGGEEVNGAIIRIGFDIGGSKIAAIALDQRGRELARLRRDVPRDYPGTLAALVELTEELRRGRGPAGSIGIGMPGLIGADGALIRVVNLPWLERRPLQEDLQAAARCPVTAGGRSRVEPILKSEPERAASAPARARATAPAARRSALPPRRGPAPAAPRPDRSAAARGSWRPPSPPSSG